MTGRVIIVTGANSGIGFETTRYLCEGGNDVILACRNEGLGVNAVQRIKDDNPYALATFMQLDLASRDSIEKFVERFRASGKKLHVLVCNAGVMGPRERQSTEDGLELVMGTNYFGHFLLTQLLLDDLKKTGQDVGNSRVVFVTSRIHDAELIKERRLKRSVAPLQLENLLLHEDNTYSGFQAYKDSKAALIMYGYHMAKLHPYPSAGVTFNSVCPGFTPTSNLNREGSRPQKAFAKWFLHRALRFMHLSQTVHEAAKAVAFLAESDDVSGDTGRYFLDGTKAQSSAETLNIELQEQLYQTTGGMLQLSGFEPIKIPQPEPRVIDQETQATIDEQEQVASVPDEPALREPSVKKDAESQCQDEAQGVPEEIHDSMMVEAGDLSNLDMTLEILDESKQLSDNSLLDDSLMAEP